MQSKLPFCLASTSLKIQHPDILCRMPICLGVGVSSTVCPNIIYAHAGIKKVALLDFDVHHGNGTQACIRNTAPGLATHTFETPYSKGLQEFPTWKPWLDSSDAENIFFARSASLRTCMFILSMSWPSPGMYQLLSNLRRSWWSCWSWVMRTAQAGLL